MFDDGAKQPLPALGFFQFLLQMGQTLGQGVGIGANGLHGRASHVQVTANRVRGGEGAYSNVTLRERNRNDGKKRARENFFTAFGQQLLLRSGSASVEWYSEERHHDQGNCPL